jgi:hypothetical protein
MLEQKSVRYYGGRKVSKTFLLPSGDITINLYFTDVKDNGNSTYSVANNLDEATHIKKTTNILDVNDGIWFEKIDYNLIKNKRKLAKSRANYATDYLVETAEQLGSSETVKNILNHFKKGFDEWQDLGDGSTFIQQLNDEPSVVDGQPNIIYYIIHTPISGFEPKTFYDSLIEHLTSTKWIAS